MQACPSPRVGKDDLIESLGSPYIESFLRYVEPTIPSSPQYHYTTWEEFQAIMEGRELLAFDVRLMIDMLEVEHGLQLLERLLASRKDIVSRQVIPHLRGDGARQIYAACLSSEGDDAAQWDRYAAHGTGYALEFDPRAVFDSIDHTLGPHATSITYDDHATRLGEVVARLDAFLKANERDLAGFSESEAKLVAKNVLSWMGGDLLRTCASLKPRGYKSEAEWRILLSGETKIATLSTGPRQVASAGTWTNEDCPIRGVVVGPRTPPDAERAVERWLNELGYNAWTEASYDAAIADAGEEDHAAISESFERGITVRRSELRWR